MPSFPVFFRLPGSLQNLPGMREFVVCSRRAWSKFRFFSLVCIISLKALPAAAVVLWNDPGPMLIHNTGLGTDILGGAVKRDDSANDTLYFKFHVEPLSDTNTEPYFAGFELFEGDTQRLAIGNSLEAWAYSAFFHAGQTSESNNPDVYIDLRTPPGRSPDSAPRINIHAGGVECAPMVSLKSNMCLEKMIW